MNVGVYSFKRVELREATECVRQIINPGLVDNIFIYSENTNKERMSQREAFKKVLDDYEKRKIELIVFKDLDSIGQSTYVRALIFRELINRKCKYCSVKENIHNFNIGGRLFTTALIKQALDEKKYGDERSKIGQEIKRKLKE